jgi:hypothetical protein
MEEIKMRWQGHTACMGQIKKSNKRTLPERCEGKMTF